MDTRFRHRHHRIAGHDEVGPQLSLAEDTCGECQMATCRESHHAQTAILLLTYKADGLLHIVERHRVMMTRNHQTAVRDKRHDTTRAVFQHISCDSLCSQAAGHAVAFGLYIEPEVAAARTHDNSGLSRRVRQVFCQGHLTGAFAGAFPDADCRLCRNTQPRTQEP